ncbi:hypothetical protein SAMN05444358_101170 [Ruegeria halocynthiae]|uniref:D-galactarate dehydratase n=1 Tax=Ruegeria halocynthiae TaxID=985054 RepID=A0A1H2RIK5_9RHOB|nr:hypothetical protein [Ruegeria halocynthiae]SDW19010.1 hypothetical protein SAMN05444358_101170 [Ruegeria halocynthiae]
MKYVLILAFALVAGCDAVRSTTDRVFGGTSAEPEAVPVAAKAPDKDPEPAAADGWAGAKTTIAGLGDPNTPGRWLQTPLVETEINGRVVVPRTGAQAYVALVPAPGPEGGGSRLSIEAMRALLVPYDELVELEVYSD